MTKVRAEINADFFFSTIRKCMSGKFSRHLHRTRLRFNLNYCLALSGIKIELMSPEDFGLLNKQPREMENIQTMKRIQESFVKEVNSLCYCILWRF